MFSLLLTGGLSGLRISLALTCNAAAILKVSTSRDVARTS